MNKKFPSTDDGRKHLYREKKKKEVLTPLTPREMGKYSVPYTDYYDVTTPQYHKFRKLGTTRYKYSTT